MSNYVQRFLLENLDIRGAIVRISTPSGRRMLVGSHTIRNRSSQLLGEMSAVHLTPGRQSQANRALDHPIEWQRSRFHARHRLQ
jgi:hypothetical protein